MEHGLRIVTLLVAAAVAVGVTSLETLQHQAAGGPHRAPAAGPPVSTALIGLVEPVEANGRVELWESARLAATPAPARPAPARPGASLAQSFGSGAVQNIIRNAFNPLGPTAVAWGLRVAHCESGFNPRAYNAAGPYYGLFQFLMSTFRATPYGSGDIYDPVANANAAAWKYAHGGAGAWGCS
ncbi:MAG TPA: transglycosylase SLT domain-containing protein [Candidatus Dormibacteraeota bacterium]|nr:transglycosylase SLT domain-containing protein [Candidatus Dormibacteraeota bacterium]